MSTETLARGSEPRRSWPERFHRGRVLPKIVGRVATVLLVALALAVTFGVGFGLGRSTAGPSSGNVEIQCVANQPYDFKVPLYPHSSAPVHIGCNPLRVPIMTVPSPKASK